MYQESSCAKQPCESLPDGSSPTTEARLLWKGLSKQHYQRSTLLLLSESDRNRKLLCGWAWGVIFCLHYVVMLPRKRIHTPLPVTLHIINITKDYKNYNISALHAAASDTRIRDRLMCAQPGQAVLLSWIGDKPTPLRAIRSWPLLPLSLATHTLTLSCSLHDNKAAVPR